MRLTHSSFVDDLLVFCHGDGAYVEVFEKRLDDFGSCFGLLPNVNKSSVFFGNISDEDQRNILEILPFVKVKLPMKYLGMAPRRNRVNNEADPAFTAAVAQAVADLLPTLTARITDEIRQNENNGNNVNRRNARRVNTGEQIKVMK
ncbi:hypothetical protein Tco_0829860 [Tanacetum coccineum]